MKQATRYRMISLFAVGLLFLSPACAPPVEGRVYEFNGGNVTQKVKPGEIADCTIPAQTITLGGLEMIDEATYYKIDPPLKD